MLRTRKGVPTASGVGVSNVEPGTIIPHVLLDSSKGKGKFTIVNCHLIHIIFRLVFKWGFTGAKPPD